MNVVNTVRRAITNHIGSRTEEKEEPWQQEVNAYRRDILRYTHIFLKESCTTEEKVDALRQLGHAAYCGGIDASKSTDEVLPHITTIIKEGLGANRDGPPVSDGANILVQALRTLSEILQTCKRARMSVSTDLKAIKALLDLINDVTHVRECRWACYNLHFLLVDNPPLLLDLKENGEAREILEMAADFPIWWQGWGRNYGHVILQMLGHRAPDATPVVD